MVIRDFVASQANHNILQEINMEDEFKCFFILYCSHKTHSLLNLRNFVANFALLCYALCEGHFWPKFGGGGHKNILVDRGPQEVCL